MKAQVKKTCSWNKLVEYGNRSSWLLMGFIITTEEFWLKRKSNQNDKAMILNGKKINFDSMWLMYIIVKLLFWTSKRAVLPYKMNKVFFAPCKGIQDSLGFQIPRCRFRIPGTAFQTLAVEFGFRIPWALFWIPKRKIPDSTSNNFPDSGIHIPLLGVSILVKFLSLLLGARSPFKLTECPQ